MKICFVANAESVHTERWVKYFILKGHDVHLISHEGRKIEGVKFYKLKSFGKSKITREKIRPVDLLTFIIRALQTRKYIRKIKPDLVHGHNVILGGFYASVAKFKPLVITAWGTDVLIAPNISVFLKKISIYTLRNASLITCDGRNTKEAMEKLGASVDKIKIIYFGIDTIKFHPDKKSLEWRKKLGLENYNIAISLRGLNPIYSIETLLYAIPIVLKEKSESFFIIGGNGPLENELKNLASSLKIEKNIIFTGNLSMEEIPQYLASSDLYISTSLSDSGLAASTGEAMASGLPVIVTDSGDSNEWIINGESGFVIPVKEHQLLAEKIIQLFNDKNMMKKYGSLNRKIIEEKQDYYKEMGKMEKLYESLIISSPF